MVILVALLASNRSSHVQLTIPPEDSNSGYHTRTYTIQADPIPLEDSLAQRVFPDHGALRQSSTPDNACRGPLLNDKNTFALDSTLIRHKIEYSYEFKVLKLLGWSEIL